MKLTIKDIKGITREVEVNLPLVETGKAPSRPRRHRGL